LSYCAPIRTPPLSDTNWGEIQIGQNHSLRAALGCVRKSDIDHLHAEAKIMPVKDHCEMLSQQFLLNSTKPNHPNHIDIMAPAPTRIMKEALLTRFGGDVRPLAPQGVIDELNYKEGLKTIHTKSVEETIRRQGPNPVLGIPAPKINDSEKTLPRKTRSTLAQLRSGHSTFLNNFLAKINPTKYVDSCPKCGQSPHNTPHLFNCPADPTSFTPRILWEDPPAAAAFLGLEMNQEAGQLDDND